MKLPEFSVNRRVTTAMIAMILVVFGFISFSRLGLDFFPDLEYPTVSVITTYRGAAPEDIEKVLTRTIEQVVSSVSRVKKVSSITSEGVSAVQVEFEWGTNLDFAAQDLRDQLALYEQYLPPDAGNPLVLKFNLSMLPVIFWGVTAPMNSFELKTLIEDNVAPRLERIDGVASAQVFSMDIREILVDVDKSALETRQISLDSIIGALRAQNLNMPAGEIVERHSDLIVRTLGEYTSLADIGRTVVGASQMGEPIYVSDVAEVKDTTKDVRYFGRVDLQKGVFLIVNKRSGGNAATVGKAVKTELAEIQKTLPPDVKFHVAMDQSDMIGQVTSRTVENAWQGGLLAILLIFLFLLNWRPTLIIALAIPLSIITTFIALYFAGYTLNLLTLGGLTLGIGMLVDNAIVVIENTFRHFQEGKGRKEGSILGASEVGMAITASTLTTIVVFLPMIFAQGITGKLTRSLALSITFSLVASLFVALTIVPMLSYLLLRPGMVNNSDRKRSDSGFMARVHRFQLFDRPRNLYRKTLTWVLKRRGRVMVGALALFVLAAALIPILGTEFMPNQDQQMIMLRVRLPVGSSLDETDRIISQVEEIMKEQPEVKIVFAQGGSSAEQDAGDASSGMSASGPHEGMLWVGLTELSERSARDTDVLERVRKRLPRLRGVRFEAVNMSQMMAGATSPVEIKLYGKDFAVLKELADSIVDRIQDVPGLRDVTHTLAQGRPEYQIQVDRERASRLGLPMYQVADTVQTATLGKVATRYREASEEIDVRVRFNAEYRSSMDEIRKIPIVTPTRQTVYLDQLAVVQKGEGPIQIIRENQTRKVTVGANIAGRDLGSVVRDIKKRISGVEKNLPAGYFLEYGGSYEQMQDAFMILAGAFLLASLLIYMVMASQFESFLHPFIIMFTIPLGLIGVVLGLLVWGKPISMTVGIGFILLAGIAVNNGIVMIDYINQLRKRGIEKRDAIIQGAVTRLRPVLLTALTTILGMLPMAISTSSGSEIRSPMAVTVLGGLTATTFLTLFIIPVIYSFFAKASYKTYKAE